jgi:hypothetical protein
MKTALGGRSVGHSGNEQHKRKLLHGSFFLGFEMMIAVLLQRDCGARAARNVNFSDGLPFFCGLDRNW